jgi:hypothetical protein
LSHHKDAFMHRPDDRRAVAAFTLRPARLAQVEMPILDLAPNLRVLARRDVSFVRFQDAAKRMLRLWTRIAPQQAAQRLGVLADGSCHVDGSLLDIRLHVPTSSTDAAFA